MNSSYGSRVNLQGPPSLGLRSGQAFSPVVAARAEGAAGKLGPAVTSPRLIIRTCKHILESGSFCRAAAVGGRAYCRAHLRLGVRRGKMARARRRAGVLELPPLTDMQAVQVGITRVRVALAADHIDADCARLLLWAMRQAAANLRFIELWPASQQTHKSKRFYQMDINHYDSISYQQSTS
jgi:hypothetical protein